MLRPKGSAEGFQCQLFVMISNGANDQVIRKQMFKSDKNNKILSLPITNRRNTICITSHQTDG